MGSVVKLIALAAVAVLAAIAANWARDIAYQVNALTVMAAASGFFIYTIRTMDAPRAEVTGYMDDVVRAGVIATAFWGMAGFAAGVYIAFQLAFPDLNWGLSFTSFGRLRPLHTSAVIFAFGGNALICTSFYIVQRTCAARLWGGNLAWFVFWGYNLFIVLAATSYLLGGSESKEYAEPAWHIDLWLTVVWVAYLAVFLGTLIKRKEPHIYVANWFLLSFIVTVAMLHVVRNLSVPASIFGSTSYSLFSGVQDAMTQWWYGHNAVGFFLTAGFLGMMYYFVPKQAERPVYSYRLSIIHFWALIFLVLDHPVDALLGRHDQRADDPERRLGQAAHRSGDPHDGGFGRLLRHVDLRGADDVDQGGELAVALHRLDHRACTFRRAGLERHDHLRRALLPGAAAVEPRAPVQFWPCQLALLAGDHRYRSLRLLDVGDRHHGGPDVA
jgi:hypothetical protein